MSDFNSEILHLLECPVCFETSKPPITLCSNGHNICSACKGKINKCPICQGSLTNTRNWHAEHSYEVLTSHKIAPALVKPVEKKKILSSKEEALLKTKGLKPQGSTKLSRSASAITHSSGSGSVSRVTCNIKTSKLQCAHEMIPSFSLKRHWNSDHGLALRMNGLSFNVTLKAFSEVAELNANGYCEPWILTFAGKFFIVMRTFTEEGIRFWVSINGDKRESAQFTAQIKLEDDKNTSISMWGGPVRSAFEEEGRENSLFISWSQIRRSAHYDSSRHAWSFQQRVSVQNINRRPS